MTRQRLPDRRLNATRKVTWMTYGGNEQTILVTFGFRLAPNVAEYGVRYEIAEVFCADFKAGSDTQAIVTDACVLISRLLQSSNDTVADLRASMCEPPSLIGCILQAGCDEEAWQADVDKEINTTAAVRTHEELYVGADGAKDEPIPLRVPWFTPVEEPIPFPWALTLLCFAILFFLIWGVGKLAGTW